MKDLPFSCLPVAEVPAEPEWLAVQRSTVIAIANAATQNRDV